MKSNSSPFFTRINFPECDRLTCLTANPTVGAFPPVATLIWCSESKDGGDFGDDDFGDGAFGDGGLGDDSGLGDDFGEEEKISAL